MQMYIQPTHSLHTSKLHCLCSCPQTQLVCLFSSLEETEERDLPIRHRQIKEAPTSLGESSTPAFHLSKDQKQGCGPGLAPQQKACGGPCWAFLSLLTPDGQASAVPGASRGITLKLSKEKKHFTPDVWRPFYCLRARSTTLLYDTKGVGS